MLDVWGDDFMIDFWIRNNQSNWLASLNDFEILHLTKDDSSDDTFKRSKIPVIIFKRELKPILPSNCDGK